ncbi:MAG: DUF4870 domain-containing protein [Spirochaetales bacterium]|nr:DUF4870 domain-containing protein [Spirochaetales bacterium]
MAKETKEARKKTSMGMDENLEALLAYLFSIIGGLIFFLGEKNSKFVRFHALQSILLGVVLIAVIIILSIIFGIVGLVLSPSAWLAISFIIGLINLVVYLGFIVLTIICMIKAYQMEGFKIPVIGEIAEKQVSK